MFGFPNLNEPLWSLNLASGGSLAAPPLISSCFALWNSREGHGGWSLPYKKLGTKQPPCVGTPQDPAWHQAESEQRRVQRPINKCIQEAIDSLRGKERQIT